MPLISVIIPLYNKGPYIARAINSVLNQTEQNFEIIIVDGHSTDEGPTIAKSFKDQRISYLEQTGSGVSSARNEGICYSQSDFIAFLDADDEWMSDHMETLLRLRKMFPEAGAYTTAYLVKYPNSRIEMANFHAIPKKPWEGLFPSYFKSATFGYQPVWTSVVGIPKKILMEMDGFNIDAWMGEDIDLWGRIALKYPIAFSWEGMGIYHTESTNRTCDKIEPIFEAIFLTSMKNALQNEEIPPELKEDLLEYAASIQIEAAYKNLRAGRSDLARINLKNCKTRYQRIFKYWNLFWSFIPVKIYWLLEPRVAKFLLKLLRHRKQ